RGARTAPDRTMAKARAREGRAGGRVHCAREVGAKGAAGDAGPPMPDAGRARGGVGGLAQGPAPRPPAQAALKHFPPKWTPVRRRKYDKCMESKAHPGWVSSKTDSI